LSRAVPPKFAGIADRLVGRAARKYFGQTVSEVMAEITDDERLKAVLCSQWGYYGAIPDDASFAIQALVTKHFLHGAYYPVGGSQRIAETLLSRVADNGGWTRISSPVDEILLDAVGNAIGVRVGDERILAGRVVSAVGAQATTQRLLPGDVARDEWAQSLAELTPASAHVCLYVGFKGDIAKAGASAANQWFNDTWDTTIESWRVDPNVPPEDWPNAPILYCSFPSLKDPEHDPGDDMLHTGEVVTFVPWDLFEPYTGTLWKKRTEEYDRFKQEMQDHLMAQYVAAMPELESMIDFVEFSTPLTTAHFDRAIGGSIYGLEPSVERYDNRWLRPASPIKNLYMSGCDVGSPGVIGAMFGGVLAALAAKPLAVGKYVREVM
jgi:all-trans-retinol 13,14-reductase